MENINEKSTSKSQQRLFGMVYKYKQEKSKNKKAGEDYLKKLEDKYGEGLPNKIKSIADGSINKDGEKTKGISKKDAEDFARTKHEDLPEKVEENKVLNFSEYINKIKS
jgi:hypothetical protein